MDRATQNTDIESNSAMQGKLDSTTHRLETLPNIDINIKEGNSLVSYFDITQDLKHYPNIKVRIEEYKKAVKNYKEGLYVSKQDIDRKIKELHIAFKNFCFQDKFKSQIQTFQKECDKYSEKYGNHLAKDDKNLAIYVRAGFSFFDFDENEAQKDFKKLQDSYNALFNLESNKPFEWRFAFPEVLDSSGDFVGFDIIIGNPPYIRQEAIKELKPHLQKAFSIYKGTSDIYTYFFELGHNLLRENGILSFITSNKYTRAGYGEALRAFLLQNTQLLFYMDFNGVKVFDSATVDTAITSFVKAQGTQPHSFIHYRFIHFDKSKSIEENIATQNTIADTIPQSACKEDQAFPPDMRTQSLKAKIESIGTPLKDWGISICRGILTGYNEAFIIDSAKREEILGACDDTRASVDSNGLNERERTEALIKPILRGRDIKRYSYEWAGLWVIFIPWHFPNVENPKTMQENEQDLAKLYPAIYQHLLQHKDNLSKRNKAETGIRYEWYCLQRWAANYYEEFAKPKIVYSEIVREPQFYLDSGEFKFGHFYAEATSFILTAKEDFSQSLEYLLGILHSKLATFAFKSFYAGGGLGESGYRYKKAFLEKLPIPKIDSKKEREFVKIIKEIIEIKNRHSEALAEEFIHTESNDTQSIHNTESKKDTSGLRPQYDTPHRHSEPLGEEFKNKDISATPQYDGEASHKYDKETSPKYNKSARNDNEKKADSHYDKKLQELEFKLDSMVFSLYGLSEKEIQDIYIYICNKPPTYSKCEV